MDSKVWYESITIWGVIITVLATVLGLVGVVVAPDIQQVLATNATELSHAIHVKDWAAAMAAAVAIVGAIMAAMGRKQADQPVHFITPFKSPPPPAAIAAVKAMETTGLQKAA